MQMIRQYHNGIERERMPLPRIAERGAQLVNMIYEQMRSAVGQIDREEITGPADILRR
jgi:hypothetical protein